MAMGEASYEIDSLNLLSLSFWGYRGIPLTVTAKLRPRISDTEIILPVNFTIMPVRKTNMEVFRETLIISVLLRSPIKHSPYPTN